MTARRRKSGIVDGPNPLATRGSDRSKMPDVCLGGNQAARRASKSPVVAFSGITPLSRRRTRHSEALQGLCRAYANGASPR